ncbi:MAG: hypothetical protein CBD74_09680 [Saprospirales bacterium TMED214]|nr:MAG: hypothetical protein CBD74_09680 [Saprospirales bacterium TMED214]
MVEASQQLIDNRRSPETQKKRTPATRASADVQTPCIDVSYSARRKTAALNGIHSGPVLAP